METMLVSMDERTLTRSCIEVAKVDWFVRLLMTVLFNNVFESKLYQLLYDTAISTMASRTPALFRTPCSVWYTSDTCTPDRTLHYQLSAAHCPAPRVCCVGSVNKCAQ